MNLLLQQRPADGLISQIVFCKFSILTKLIFCKCPSLLSSLETNTLSWMFWNGIFLQKLCFCQKISFSFWHFFVGKVVVCLFERCFVHFYFSLRSAEPVTAKSVSAAPGDSPVCHFGTPLDNTSNHLGPKRTYN